VECSISDAHAGLKEARQACFSGVPWQRCQFHLMQNALAHVPRQELKREVLDDLHGMLDAADQAAATEQLQRVVRKYEKSAPKLAAWMEENVPESLTVFRLPARHRQRLRTTKLYEQIGRLQMELAWLKKKLPRSSSVKRQWIEPEHRELSIRRQCELLELERSTYSTRRRPRRRRTWPLCERSTRSTCSTRSMAVVVWRRSWG
jgi:transposase-like protein